MKHKDLNHPGASQFSMDFSVLAKTTFPLLLTQVPKMLWWCTGFFVNTFVGAANFSNQADKVSIAFFAIAVVHPVMDKSARNTIVVQNFSEFRLRVGVVRELVFGVVPLLQNLQAILANLDVRTRPLSATISENGRFRMRRRVTGGPGLINSRKPHQRQGQ